MEKIEILESKVAVLERHAELLMRNVDDQEQYNRRLSLRINGISCEDNETSEDVLEKLKHMMNGIGAAVPDEVLDRAHRIGKTTVDGQGRKQRQVIVRLLPGGIELGCTELEKPAKSTRFVLI